MNCEQHLARGGAKLVGGFLFGRHFFVCEVRLKAAPATRFVHSCGSYYDQILGGDQTLRVHGGIAAADTDGQQFGDLFGNGQQTGHGLEGPAHEIGVQTGNHDALAHVRKLRADVDQFFAEKLGLVDADDFGARLDFLQDFSGRADVEVLQKVEPRTEVVGIDEAQFL